MENKEQVTILLAEDDDGHARLIQDLFKNAGVYNPVTRFRNGQEAWDFVSGAARPCLDKDKQYLMLLDIRMPVLDGVEVLRRLKLDERFKNIPVIMLTTTDDPREIERCYALGCNCYLTKPVEFEGFTEVIRRLGLFIMVIKVTPALGRKGEAK